MRKKILFRLVIACTIIGISFCGCKSAEEYNKDRAGKAAVHFQKAKYREFQSGKVMTLPECIAIALKNNLQVRVSEMELQVQKEFETAEALGMLPQLNINNNFTTRSNYNASGSQKIVATGKSYEASYSEDRTINYLNIDLLFSALDFGLTFYNTRQQADKAMLTKQRTIRATQNLTFDVVRAYFNVVAAQRASQITTKLLEDCGKRINQIYELSSKHLITPQRAFEDTRRFSEMEKRLTEYTRMYDNACVELRTLMGYYPNADIQVDDTYLNKVPEFYLPTIDTMEQIAILQRPELYETDIQKHINILECRKTILLMFPNVKLYADWSYSNNSFLYNQSWFELGVRAAYNLLKLPQQIAKYRAYSSQVEAEETRAYAQAVAVMAQVRIAHGNYLSALIRYKMDDKIYRQYEQHLQNTMAMRMIPQYDIDHILMQVTQTNIDKFRALGEYYVAYYRLLNVMGVQNFDYRAVDEMTEELKSAEERVRQDIRKNRAEFDKRIAELQAKQEESKKMQSESSAAQHEADQRYMINKEIDARIKAESAQNLKSAK